MNLEKITIQDCIDMHEMKGQGTLINDGKIMGFKKEIPAQTANQNGDK